MPGITKAAGAPGLQSLDSMSELWGGRMTVTGAVGSCPGSLAPCRTSATEADNLEEGPLKATLKMKGELKLSEGLLGISCCATLSAGWGRIVNGCNGSSNRENLADQFCFFERCCRGVGYS